MKLSHLVLLTLLSASPLAFAGQQISESKETKEAVHTEELFKDRELQLADYAVYSVGKGPTHMGLFRNHAWGDGGELNYFFTRYIGIGIEYSEMYGVESPDTNGGYYGAHRVDRYHVGGDLIFRWPIESAHLAPYLLVGGGADFGDRKWGEFYTGLGFEYRFFQTWIKLVPLRVGFFMDARWTYMGDRYFPDDNASRGDLNSFSARAGLRFTY